MRRPSRLTLAAVLAVLPLTLASCAGEEPPIRAENGSGVDGEGSPSEDDSSDDGDQGGSDADSDPDEG